MKVYSFINSYDENAWKQNPAKFPLERVFEYTEDHIVSAFRTADKKVSDELTKHPALFSHEHGTDSPAFVGWIDRIGWLHGQPMIHFRADDTFRPIDQRELYEIKWELGLEDFEFYRTHWSIKQIDLITVLRNRGFEIPSPAIEFESRKDNGSAAQSTNAQQSTTKSIFISYSHADAEYLSRLKTHLAPIKKWADISIWDDTRIKVGDQWKSEIDAALNNCAAAILLVSADFLASEFISENELPPLLKRAEISGSRIIPVIVKPSLYTSHPELKSFQALNAPERSVVTLNEAEREELWSKLARTVLDMVTSKP